MVNIDSVGKKWTDKILHSLKERPKRFNTLMETLSSSNKKISSKALADRLKDLEKQELIAREIQNSRPPFSIYKITSKGEKALNYVIKLSQL